MAVKRGDKVILIVGKDKGKEGTIERVLPSRHQVVVGGLNLAKRHFKPGRHQKYSAGGIVEVAMPLDWSNVKVTQEADTTLTKEGQQ